METQLILVMLTKYCWTVDASAQEVHCTTDVGGLLAVLMPEVQMTKGGQTDLIPGTHSVTKTAARETNKVEHPMILKEVAR